MRLNRRIFLVFLGPVLGLGGCAVTTLDGHSLQPRSDEFAAYVEAVFRRQNELAVELELALDDAAPGSERYLTLEQAEVDLLTACSGLNALAAARRDGAKPGGLTALKRARQAPECERASRAVAALL
jgi:hypothetical protein